MVLGCDDCLKHLTNFCCAELLEGWQLHELQAERAAGLHCLLQELRHLLAADARGCRQPLHVCPRVVQISPCTNACLRHTDEAVCADLGSGGQALEALPHTPAGTLAQHHPQQLRTCWSASSCAAAGNASSEFTTSAAPDAMPACRTAVRAAGPMRCTAGASSSRATILTAHSADGLQLQGAEACAEQLVHPVLVHCCCCWWWRRDLAHWGCLWRCRAVQGCCGNNAPRSWRLCLISFENGHFFPEGPAA